MIRPMAERSSASRRVGRYEIFEQLGRGGMAVVYLARQLDLDRNVALKELGSFQLGATGAAERFLREARMAGSLSHPNIVTVHDYFEQDGIPYIAMEYVPGGSLRPSVGRLTVAQIAGTLEGVLAGLAEAERAGIVHRDLKPENIMITADGRAKIADFGIAKASQSAGVTSDLTATGAAVGTPTYMAPEQAMAEAIGPWTDLYAVGVIAYEQVVGRPPFHGTDTPMAMLMRHVNEPVVPAADIKPGVDPALSDWIGRLLVKDPAQRTQSARAAWDELEEILVELLDPRWRRDARLEPVDERAEPVGERADDPAAPADEGFVTFEARPSRADEESELPPEPTPLPDAPPVAEPPPPEQTPATTRATAQPPAAPPTQPTGLLPRRPPDGSPAAPPVERQRRARLLAPLLAAVAIGAAVVAVVLVTGGGGSKPHAGASSTEHASTAAKTSTARNAAAVSGIAHTSPGGGIVVRGPIPLTTGGTPAGLAVAGRDAWLADPTNDLAVLVREDGSELRVRVGDAPSGIAIDPATGNVWVANRGSGDVTVLDPSGNVVKRSITVGGEPSAIAIGDGVAWVVDGGGTTVTRIDPRSFATRQIDVGGRPTSIGVHYSRVWVGTSHGSITVLGKAGSLNGSVPRLGGSGLPVAITASNGVWVLRDGEGLTRVDPRVSVATRKTRPYEYLVRPDSPSSGADPVDVDSLDHGLGDNTIWVLSSSDHQLLRIGTQGSNNDRVLAKISVGRAPARLAVASHVVWVSDPGARALYEITY